MNAASHFFRLCRQRQHPPSFAATTRHFPGSQSIFQRRTFLSSSRHYAETIDGTAQSDLQNREPLTDDPTTLFCGNLAFGVKEETILQAFGKFGTVTHARLGNGYKNKNRNGWNGFNGGFCFVEFASPEEAGAALEAMNGTEIDGLPINLKYYQPSFRTGKTNDGSKESNQSKKPVSKQDEEYTRTQPLKTGTVSRTGTMLKTVAVTTNHRRLDKYTQTHHVQEETELVHDPQGILVEGDLIKYQHFPPDLYAERAMRGKKNVKFVLKEVVTPFGIPVEDRTPNLGVEQAPTKKTKRRGSKDKVPTTAVS
jgi:RNA recognition motif-containing protein